MRVWLSVRKTPRMTEDVIRPGIRIPRAEKCLHKPFMEILSRGDVSATQSSWPINLSSCKVENLPTVAYSKCDGIH